MACYVIMFMNFSSKSIFIYLFIYLSISFICLISFCCSQLSKGKICGRKFRLGEWGYNLSGENSGLTGADLAQPYPAQPFKKLKFVKTFIVTPNQIPPKTFHSRPPKRNQYYFYHFRSKEKKLLDFAPQKSIFCMYLKEQ